MGSKTLAVTVKQNLLGFALKSSAENKDLAAMKFVLEQGWDSKKGDDLVHRWKWGLRDSRRLCLMFSVKTLSEVKNFGGLQVHNGS